MLVLENVVYTCGQVAFLVANPRIRQSTTMPVGVTGPTQPEPWPPRRAWLTQLSYRLSAGGTAVKGRGELGAQSHASPYPKCISHVKLVSCVCVCVCVFMLGGGALMRLIERGGEDYTHGRPS